MTWTTCAFETTRPPKYVRCAPAGADSACGRLGLPSACPCCSGSTPRDDAVSALAVLPTSLPTSLPMFWGTLQPAASTSARAPSDTASARPRSRRTAFPDRNDTKDERRELRFITGASSTMLVTHGTMELRKLTTQEAPLLIGKFTIVTAATLTS